MIEITVSVEKIVMAEIKRYHGTGNIGGVAVTLYVGQPHGDPIVEIGGVLYRVRITDIAKAIIEGVHL